MTRPVNSPRQMALKQTLQRNVFRKPSDPKVPAREPVPPRPQDDLADPLPNWASEFPATDEARAFPPEAVSPELLEAFLKAARARAGGEWENVSASHLSAAFLEDLPAVPEAARPQVPAALKAFLGHLEAAGRLAGGRAAGAALAAAAPAYLSRASGKAEPIRTAAKIGRNDPCPCGSGKKFKKCCG